VNTPGTSGFAKALAAAQGADVIVAAMGLDTCQETFCSEGEANDRAVPGGKIDTIDLPGSQLALLQALQSKYPTTPIVVVLLNGGPISSPATMQLASAVLEAWYPGYEGGTAVADVLFGRYSPAGRLPVTIVKSTDDLPLYTDVILSTYPGRTNRYFQKTPLLPFGFGLSYATFVYTNLSISPAVLQPSDASVTVSATLSHVSGMVSDEVVQLYGRFEAPSTGRASYPLQQLLSFTRIKDIESGTQQTVQLTVAREAFALVDPAGTMRVQPGTWTLWLGGGPPSNAAFGGGDVLKGSLRVE
jgi:beta-glucosidase